MKRRLLMLCLLVGLLVFPCAQAEPEITLSAATLAVESVLDFTVSGEGESFRFTMLHEGEVLFTSESTLDFGSYVPRKTGEYTLKVNTEDGSAEADFTVTDKLLCAFEPLPSSPKAGDALTLRVRAQGGTGVYRYMYAVYAGDRELLSQEGGEDWLWFADEAGDYRFRVTVVDSAGAVAHAEASLTVAAGPGIGAKASGGGLLAHGGHRSWVIYAPENWTASTDADFITLENETGAPGDTLTVTISEETDAARSGNVTIRSGSKALTLTVRQAKGHGVEEELFLDPADALPLAVEGQTHALWLYAEGERSFYVDAMSDWDVSLEGDFLTAEAEGDALILNAAANEGAAARSGIATLVSPDGTAYVHVYQLPAENVVEELVFAQEFEIPQEAGTGFVVYSQSSGLWKDRPYGKSTLEQSGCAIFALSHALQCLGIEGEETLPQALAKKYAFALREGGTINSTLVGNAGDDLGFKTRYELYESLGTIRSKMQDGAVFSFAIVNGHIAMVSGMSEDGSMFRIIDSAPSATWERIKNARLYRQAEDGSFAAIDSLTELDGIRYYIENNAFGGAVYYLEAEYVARRGVRLIQLK